MNMDVSNDASHEFQSDQARPVEKPPSTHGVNYDMDDRLVKANSNGLQMQQLADWMLHLLSTCGNESLLLVLVCLMGATYIILGRLGILLIGIALGISLHSSWEGASNHHSSGSLSSNRKQLSLNIAYKVLDWNSKQRTGINPNVDNAGEYTTESELDMDVNLSISVGPVTATALHSLIEAAVRDYVK
jgi:hypothetical protein